VISRADLAGGLDAAARQDWATAYREFKEAAAHGNANAEINLGNLYMRGLGVNQSYEEARSWYEKSATQGNPIAEAKLGVLYYYGLGVEENRTRAAEWFQKAGDQGDAHSAMTLGEMYSIGEGIPSSRTEAYIWYTIASELGNQAADEPRFKLAAELSAGEISSALERVEHWRNAYALQVEKANRHAAKTPTPPEKITTDPKQQAPQVAHKKSAPSPSPKTGSLKSVKKPAPAKKKSEGLRKKPDAKG
jgi:TPR repeat protein